MFKTMWPLGKSSSGGTNSKVSLGEDVQNEVRSAAPGKMLSYNLRSNLERLDKKERRELVSVLAKQDECSPLFVACKKGNVEIAEYLIEVCNAGMGFKLWLVIF